MTVTAGCYKLDATCGQSETKTSLAAVELDCGSSGSARKDDE